MRFRDIPETIKCPSCGGECFRSIASSGPFEQHASYYCRRCIPIRLWSRTWTRIKVEDWPARAKCPRCGRWAKPETANDEGRVVYEHPIDDKFHQFELERQDQGWGTYQGRAEIVRVYETRYDCAAGPG